MHLSKTQYGIAVLALFLLGSWNLHAAPTNDNFANATVITNFPATITGDNFGATIEPGEFERTWYPVEGSVWYSWTAPFTGVIGIADDQSSGSPWLKVCVGSNVMSLTNLVSENLYIFHPLNVTQGTTYYFDIDRNMSAAEGEPFQFRLVSLPVNDRFSDGLPLVGKMLETFGDSSFATAEPGEPNYTSGSPPGSVWWNWTAPEPGTYRITGGPGLHIFTGDSVTNLTLETFSTGYDTAWLNATTGIVYHIRITGAPEKVRLAIYPAVPVNDDFENRQTLVGSSLEQFGTTIGATSQTADPVIHIVPGGPTVWYSWTASTSGLLEVIATNLSGHPLIPRFKVGIFSGNQLDHLQKLAGGQDETAAMVVAGRTYVIGVTGDSGDFRLGLNFLDFPENDRFSNRLVLSGPTVIFTNDNRAATLEPGEPTLVKNTAGASLWYQWTASSDGLARFVAQGSDFAPLICVYQGGSLSKLKRLANSLNTSSGVNAFCSIRVKIGATYVFSVDGRYSDGRGPLFIGVDLTTFRITNPLPGALINPLAPPTFSVNVPNPSVDGVIQVVNYFVVHPRVGMQLVGTSSTPPFDVVPTNLPAGPVTLLAVGTNAVGDPRLAPQVLVRVRPVNDDFAQGTVLNGYEWEATGTTAQATREKGEPGHGPASVWWTWTAPSSGSLRLQTFLGDSHLPISKRTVAIYTGPDVAHLRRVLSVKGNSMPGISVVGGTTYHMVVAAKSPELDSGRYEFLIRGRLESTTSFNEPTSDTFREPVDIPVGVATGEDPAGIQRIDFLASDGYTNNQAIATVTNPPYRFIWSNAPPGAYTLEARVTKWVEPNPPSATTQIFVRPANDNFADRIVLQTNFSWLTHRIAGASREPGEPVHNGNPSAPSAWWSWTAPVDGRVYLSDPSGSNTTGFAIYAGTNLTSLTAVTNDVYPYYTFNIKAQVHGGTTYQIAAIPGSQPNVNAQLRFYPPPVNDNFSNRLTLTGSSVAFEGYTVGATREANEPGHVFAPGGGAHTVWWTWTAPSRGGVVLNQTSGTYVYHRVYSGDTLASLQPVAPPGSRSSFETQSNVAYQIVFVGDYEGQEQGGGLLQFTPTPTNDLFATRTFLNGTNLTVMADNRGASKEAGEPPQAPDGSGRTLWWSWTAPADGTVYASVPRHTATLDAFQGDAIGSQELVPDLGRFREDRIYFHVASNETYQIRFDADGPVSGVPVTIQFIPAPPNDHFTDATVLTGIEVSTNGTLRGATPELGDPSIWPGADRTVWYSWTAPQSGGFIVIGPLLQAFTGSSLSNLVVAGIRNQNDSVLINAQAGTNYHFALATFWEWEPDYPDDGPFQLLLFPGSAPANDNFTNAQVLTGTSGSIVATNWAASLEAHDPPIVNWDHLQRTLWYRWQAPDSGLLVFTNTGSTANQVVLGAYLGTNLSNMIGDRETAVHSNETVHILVDNMSGAGGVIQLNYAFLPAPPNDDPEQAAPLSGVSCLITGNLYTATSPRVDHGYLMRDAWWLWTAPGAGHVTITNLDSGANPGLWVHAGSPTNDPIAYFFGTDNVLQFDAVAGGQYYVQAAWGLGADNLNLSLIESLDPPTLSFSVTSSGKASAATLVAPVQVRLASPRLLSDGRFAFQIQGSAGARYQLEASSDLTHWDVIRTGTLSSEDEEVVDEIGTNDRRFYRVR